MPLTSGTRIGVYEIVGVLGAGGMGEVYRARDTRLERDVALKVLPELFTSDPERLARFEREAKVLASLNHPNIAQVYGFETQAPGATGGSAIAMEFVDGPTLAELIQAGVPLERALPIAKQIAAALEAAHDQGIIHRDLKPANIKVRDEHDVKVLDFGLAKVFATEADGSASNVSDSPTLTARTQMGVILGTAAYMSPEQAKGRPVDRRADVWAFGVVLYEMLAGRRAFDGDDVSDVLASVLKSEPDWNALPADVPAPVRRLLRRCLEKDPRKRLRDIGEGMLQLEEALAGGRDAADWTTSGTMVAVSSTSGVTPGQRPFWRRAVPFAITAIVAAALATAATIFMRPSPSPPRAVRFQHVPPATAPLFNSLGTGDLAISPDGRRIVYSAAVPSGSVIHPYLYMRTMDQPEAAPLRGADLALGPFFSPDGEWVGFHDRNDPTNLKKIQVSGGPPVAIVRAASAITGAAWMADGFIVFGRRTAPLSRVPEAGGTPEEITTLDTSVGETEHLWPSPVPGTPVVVFAAWTNGVPQLAAVDVATRKTVRLNVQGSQPRYLSTGHIVFGRREGTLHVVRFDPATLTVSGNPAPVLEGVGVKSIGALAFDVSSTGDLVYAPGGIARADRSLTWVDRSGKETPIAAPLRNYFYARISPDGSRLSLDIRDEEQDIWIWDLRREVMARLTARAGADEYGIWTPDHRVIFASDLAGRIDLFRHRPDAIGEPEQLGVTSAERRVAYPNAITPDGTQLVFRSATGGKNDLFVVNLSGNRTVRTLLGTPHEERNPSFSPDGKYMAFESDMTGGRLEVFIRPFPDVDSGQWKVSVAGGDEPVWSPTGREIFYIADGKMMSVGVTITPGGPELGKPVALFASTPFFFGGVGRNYDIARDGQRFVMVKNPPTTGGGLVPISVVLNWGQEIRDRVK